MKHFDNALLSFVEALYEVLRKLVLILLNEPCDGVHHVLGRVFDPENKRVELIAEKVFIFGVEALDLIDQLDVILVVSLRHGTIGVDEVEDALRLFVEHGDDPIIVIVGNQADVLAQPLVLENYFLGLENVADVQVLQLFVGVVDTELLYGVDLKVFKTKYIQ